MSMVSTTRLSAYLPVCLPAALQGGEGQAGQGRTDSGVLLHANEGGRRHAPAIRALKSSRDMDGPPTRAPRPAGPLGSAAHGPVQRSADLVHLLRAELCDPLREERFTDERRVVETDRALRRSRSALIGPAARQDALDDDESLLGVSGEPYSPASAPEERAVPRRDAQQLAGGSADANSLLRRSGEAPHVERGVSSEQPVERHLTISSRRGGAGGVSADCLPGLCWRSQCALQGVPYGVLGAGTPSCLQIARVNPGPISRCRGSADV
jgi:hypothetical protein